MENAFAWRIDQPLWLDIDGVRLEARYWGEGPDIAPTLVLLHEGLGCVAQWKDFPQQLADATEFGVFAYSRSGYGQSDPAPLPRPLDYMTREALDVLPKVLDQIGFRRGVLLGHSDGASIAAIHVGSLADFRVRGVCMLAPHFFTEPSGLAAIADAKVAFENGDLRARLAKHHVNPDIAFRGWNDAWLDPEFREWNIEEVISYFRVPALVIQGRDDPYGTLRQVEAVRDGAYSPVEVEILDDCGHAPHVQQKAPTIAAIASFLAQLVAIETEHVPMV